MLSVFSADGCDCFFDEFFDLLGGSARLRGQAAQGLQGGARLGDAPGGGQQDSASVPGLQVIYLQPGGVLQQGERLLVPTGFAIAVPRGYEAQVRPRSGLALRYGIILPNAPGTIDSDYRGELKVIVMNAGAEPFAIKRGDRIAQLVVAPVVQAQWEEIASLDDTERGAGGFGSTGA